MRLGIVAYASKTGLGYQTRDYYRHLNPVKTLLIDISGINGQEQHYGWYKDAQICRGIPKTIAVSNFLQDLDVVLMAETPLNYELYRIARDRGIKTAVAYNYEFFDWFKYPDRPTPDLLIAPSKWNYDIVDDWAKKKGIKHLYLHHPVDREEFKFKLRTSKKFVHIAGNPASNDRNGTWFYMDAMPDGKVLTQSEDLARQIRSKYRHSQVYTNIADNKLMYEMGDILVLPRRYGGNCLPLNEALSCGMPVIMPNISPNDEILPKEWLVDAYPDGYFEPRTKIDLYTTPSKLLRDKIEWFRTQDIIKLSMQANEIADTISWETLKPKWVNTLESLIKSNETA